jgi:hypothetical protein
MRSGWWCGRIDQGFLRRFRNCRKGKVIEISIDWRRWLSRQPSICSLVNRTFSPRSSIDTIPVCFVNGRGPYKTGVIVSSCQRRTIDFSSSPSSGVKIGRIYSAGRMSLKSYLSSMVVTVGLIRLIFAAIIQRIIPSSPSSTTFLLALTSRTFLMLVLLAFVRLVVVVSLIIVVSTMGRNIRVVGRPSNILCLALDGRHAIGFGRGSVHVVSFEFSLYGSEDFGDFKG